MSRHSLHRFLLRMDRLPVVAIVTLVIVGPFLLFPEILSASVRLPVVVGATLAAFVLAIGLLGPGRPLRSFVGVLAVTALMGWLQVSTSQAALSHFAGLGLGLLVMSVAASRCDTEDRLAVGVGLFLVFGLAVLTLGLVGTTVTTPGFVPAQFVSWLPQVALGLPGLANDGRVNPNALGGTALLVAPLGIALSFLPRHSSVRALTMRWLGVFTSVMVSLVLLVTDSRSAWIAVWITLVVLSLRMGSRWTRRLVALAILLTVSLAVAVSLSFSDWTGYDRVIRGVGLAPVTINESGVGANVDQRIEIWRRGIEQLKSSPWSGIGLNEFRRVSEESSSLHSDIAPVHNIFLQTALDLGLIGLMAYVGLVGMLLFRSDRASRGPRVFAARTAAGGGCLW